MAEVDFNYMFGLPPERAIEYLQAKGFAITFDWHEMLDAAHARAFTVAKAMKLDVLQSIRDALDKALANGETLQTFQKQLTPELQRLGWWGRKEVLNEATGELRMAQLGNPYRLETIYQANLQTAYMAGRYRSQAANVANRPYWMYVAVMDSRTRPAHAELNGLVFRSDDPFWDSHYPPNGFRCRCRVRALNQATLDTLTGDGQAALRDSAGSLTDVEKPLNVQGDMTTVTSYTGADLQGRKFSMAPDPGWNSNPGAVGWQPDPNKYSPDIAALLGGRV